jgi:hypothetical protein
MFFRQCHDAGFITTQHQGILIVSYITIFAFLDNRTIRRKRWGRRRRRRSRRRRRRR